jgi:hypothetical protein
MTFEAVVGGHARRAVIPVPFDPDEVWGRKPRHHVGGTIDGRRIRAVVVPVGDGHGFTLGPAWQRECGVQLGARVVVELTPEGPQRADLAPDIADALEREPDAGAFFDALAQFYRRGYLRWIDGTKRRPEVRAARIAEMIGLLKAGHKERPRT